MTIAGLSTNISTSGITHDIQIAMLKKNLDTVETAGADIAKMMEASVKFGVRISAPSAKFAIASHSSLV